MSGVVFQVQASSASREVDGKRLFFCCETCATYFMKNREHVLAVRGISPTPK